MARHLAASVLSNVSHKLMAFQTVAQQIRNRTTTTAKTNITRTILLWTAFELVTGLWLFPHVRIFASLLESLTTQMLLSSTIRSLRVLHALQRSSGMRQRDLEAFQSECLRRLVAHAYNNVPYYRRLFDRHGLAPRHIQGLGDLSRIPVTRRADLQAASPEDLVARGLDPSRLITNTTSGSSGRPLTIHRTWLEQNLLHLFRLRGLRYVGVGLRDRVALLARGHTTHFRDNKAVGRILRGAGLLRWAPIDLYADPREIVLQLRVQRPDVVSGFPSALIRVAEAFQCKDREIIQPRLVVTGGEVLTVAARRVIGEMMRAPIFELYSSHEFNLIAWQCRQTSTYHTCDDAVIVEALANGHPVDPGEQGELVGTNLHCYAMPFIRYALGDLVVRGTPGCTCGVGFSRIEAIQGRTLDLFTLPDGRVLHPFAVVEKFVQVPTHQWIRQYQLVQEKEDLIVLRVVLAQVPPPDTLELLDRSLGAFLGPDVRFKIREVSEIAREPSGKFRVCRSLVQT
jgi:phenylacetate-CoA ligase